MSRDLEKIKLDIINLKEALEKISSTVGDIQKKIEKIDDNIQQSSPSQTTSMISDQVRDQIQHFLTANPISAASVVSLNQSNLDLDFLTTAPQKFADLAAKVDANSAQILHVNQDLYKEVKDFHVELSASRLPTNISISSALSDLTTVIQNFAIVQESVLNKPALFSDPSCASFLFGYIHHLRYRHKNGSLTFLQVLQKSPSVFRIFLNKIRTTFPGFTFSPADSDFHVLRNVLEKVFYPEGFTVEGFQLLISAYPMKTPITIQTAYEYALFVKDVLEALADILPKAATPISEFWRVVRNGIERTHPIYHKLQSEHPQQYEFFYKSLERKINAFFESSPPSRVSADSNFSSLSASSPFQRQLGPTHSGSTPHSTMSPTNRMVNSVQILSQSCENCNLPGHDAFNCPREFCKTCQNLSEQDFFHRPQECCYNTFHEDS